TLIFNIHSLDWDDELLKILDIPRAMLPEVKPSSCIYGETTADMFGQSIPIAGVAGDQQAATFGQACFTPGMAKNTYGTGCFMLMNTGTTPVASKNQLLTTIGWGLDDEVVYCLEGSIFIAGAVVQWLRDGLGLISTSSEVEALAATVDDSEGVIVVPAFVGLGAPYWDPSARGAILGLTRGTQAGHLARAAIESMAFQSRDVLDAMTLDAELELAALRVDGGASVNDSLMQFQADLLDVVVRRPVVSETTALGVAYLAGLAVGFWQDANDVTNNWALDREFVPQMQASESDQRYAVWKQAVERVCN
ncbi:MAG: FGGY-family carbohydrate kinase, partial [Pirellulaceae bacterium]